MIRGEVVGLQAQVSVVFCLSHRSDEIVDFLVDTGFEGALTLPPEYVAALQLPFFEPTTASLADNSEVSLDSYVARIIWDGAEIDVIVLATGQRPLLGTALLKGRRLCADFENGGPVEIANLR